MPCQFVYLTETLPHSMEREFERRMLIDEAKYIQVCTDRKNFEYSIEICSEEKMEKEMRVIVEEELNELQESELMIIFCRTKE